MDGQDERILKLIAEKDMSAFEVMKFLTDHSDDGELLTTGKVLPHLHSLEKRRYLKSYYWKNNDKVRKYYTLKSKGGRHYEDKD